MKENCTEIVCILDMSGSMWSLDTDTIGGYNSLIAKQKEIPQEAYVTTVLFNDHYTLLIDHEDINTVQRLTSSQYQPHGGTALMDAVGRTIDTIGKRLSNTPEEERPDKVIFMITTDGYENGSQDYTRSRMKEMIQHQQNKYSWEFLFVGAGIDAYGEAESLGIDGLHAMCVSGDSAGVSTAYTSVNAAFTSTRCCASKTLTSSAWKGGQTSDDVIP